MTLEIIATTCINAISEYIDAKQSVINKVTDVWEIQLNEERILPLSGNTTDVSNISKGFYFLNLETGGNILAKKVFVE